MLNEPGADAAPVQTLPEDVDPRLWFVMDGCAGRHYLVAGNPHTFHGRMSAWCAPDARYTRVSRNDILESSDEARYFVLGFLCGNEPSPPENWDIDKPAMERWRHAVALFRESGYWRATDPESCAHCGNELLPSDPGTPDDLCHECAGAPRS